MVDLSSDANLSRQSTDPRRAIHFTWASLTQNAVDRRSADLEALGNLARRNPLGLELHELVGVIQDRLSFIFERSILRNACSSKPFYHDAHAPIVSQLFSNETNCQPGSAKQAVSAGHERHGLVSPSKIPAAAD